MKTMNVGIKIIAVIAVAGCFLGFVDCCLHSESDCFSSSGQHCISCCPIEHEACLSMQAFGVLPALGNPAMSIYKQNIYSEIFPDCIDHPPKTFIQIA
jgi:hypothetical protein